jgi:hypothetical protein
MLRPWQRAHLLQMLKLPIVSDSEISVGRGDGDQFSRMTVHTTPSYVLRKFFVDRSCLNETFHTDSTTIEAFDFS